MKELKTIAVLFLAVFFALSVSAQTATAPASKAASANVGPKGQPITDPVDPDRKGLHGETVYKNSKGTYWYYDKYGNKQLYKPTAASPTPRR